MELKFCHNCKYYRAIQRSMLEPCSLHPYYNRNKNYDCKDYEIKWYKFFKFKGEKNVL